MTIVRVVDVETTGIPSETETHALVEVGWVDVVVHGDSVDIAPPVSHLCNPGRPIPVEAQAVHHIRDRDVADAPPPDQILKLLVGADYYCAHNAAFEEVFVGTGGKPWLCTFKSALRVWPDAPSHSNQALRYWRNFDDEEDFDRALAMPSHRAGPDAYTTAFILRDLLGLASMGDIQHWSSGPALLVKCGFGKHRGKKWEEVPRDYLQWVIGNIKDNRDVRATAKYWMKKSYGGGE